MGAVAIQPGWVVDNCAVPQLAICADRAKELKVRIKVGIYVAGLLRQIAAGTGNFLGAGGVILGSSGVSTAACIGAVASCVGSMAAAAVLFVTGPITTFIALKQMPGVHKEVKKREGIFLKAKTNIGDNLKPSIELKDALKEALNGLTIAKLACANNWMSLGMGFERMSVAIITTLEFLHEVVHLLSLPLQMLTAFIALHAVGSFIYFTRGAVLAWSETKNLELIYEFDKEFRTHTTLESAMGFMRTKEALGQDYLGLRLDLECLDSRSANDNPQEYRKQVDKAIFSKRLKHTIGQRSGYLMMAGALLAATTLLLTPGGIPCLLVAGVSALILAYAEIQLLKYYDPVRFQKLLDSKYSTKPDLPLAPIQRPAPAPVQPIVPPVEAQPRSSRCPPLFSLYEVTQRNLNWVRARLPGGFSQEVPDAVAS